MRTYVGRARAFLSEAHFLADNGVTPRRAPLSATQRGAAAGFGIVRAARPTRIAQCRIGVAARPAIARCGPTWVVLKAGTIVFENIKLTLIKLLDMTQLFEPEKEISAELISLSV